MSRFAIFFRGASIRHLKPLTRAIIGLTTFAMVATFSLISAGVSTKAQAAAGCSASTIAGTYVFDLRGFLSPSFSGDSQTTGDFFPVAAAGTWSFDGQNTSSRALVASVGGKTFPLNDSGPYTVNSDCTASATFADGIWYMVIAAKGKEIRIVNSTGGRAVAAALTRE